ncbi:MAG: sigma-54-dependent Fis family transcriptional regulator [Spirochaetes bacterium]|nr:MAG: sigma-54-dependent Fis family transcriptional regulator [Spirochaetota bacterium]
MGKILVVDDNPSILKYVEDILEGSDREITSCGDGISARDAFRASNFDLVISDLAMPGIDGFELITEIRAMDPDVPIIIITGVGGVDEAVMAIKKGASDFVIKPFQHQEFRVKVEKNLEYYNLKKEVERLKRECGDRDGQAIVVGSSQIMKRLVSNIRQVARSNASIVIYGESGTGKELIAKSIHRESDRRDRPFLPIDCSALTETIIESELFGHVKGAFTGADRAKKGLLEEADGGTVFLDEIGNLNWQTQSKLLRFLQEREVKPVGSSKVTKVNVRIISATNANLRKEIETGKFREDLFYRLSGIELNVPPLRDRLEDLPYLAEHFIRKYARDLGKETAFIDGEAIEILMKRAWNGNVRELEHLIEHAIVVETHERVTAATILRILPERAENVAGNGSPSIDAPRTDLGEVVASFEKGHILKVIDLAGNNRARAARMLGISRSVLYEKLKKHGIE